MNAAPHPGGRKETNTGQKRTVGKNAMRQAFDYFLRTADIFGLFMGLLLGVLALCVLIPIFQAAGRSIDEARQEREEAARQEEAERQAAERQREREAADAARKIRAEARKAAVAERQAAKLEAARKLAEYKRQALEAERELRALRAGKKAAHPAADADRSAPMGNGAGPFAGETLAFTGKIPGLNREQAIIRTERKGGKGYGTINTRCTVLVIGKAPGKCQLERAQAWHIKTMTWQEWYMQVFGFVPQNLQENAA